MGAHIRKLRDFIRHWLAVGRMGSEELAAMTLPPWLLTTLHVRNEVKQDYIGLIAAGVAFYFLLAAFPALAAAVSLFGLYFDPYVIIEEIYSLDHFLPQEVMDILINQISTLGQSTNKSLSISLLLSLAFTVYSATRGTRALIQGFNIAYNATEKRGLVRLMLVSYGITFLMLSYFIVALVLIAGLPAAIQFLPVPVEVADFLKMLRWPLLFAMGILGLEVLYTLGPCRRRKRYTITPGAVAATLMWVAGSGLFSLFVSNFTNFNQAYGSLGAVVILILWFWVSALTILIGAEINGAMEKKALER